MSQTKRLLGFIRALYTMRYCTREVVIDVERADNVTALSRYGIFVALLATPAVAVLGYVVTATNPRGFTTPPQTVAS